MKRNTKSTSIIIGSQKINSLLEFFVADIFGVRPFQTPKSRKIPFYLLYRSSEHAVKSCFGGMKNPPGRKGKLTPGIYYVNKDNNWALCPWVANKEGAALVITLWDPGLQKLEMAVLGFSGRSTDALGKQLTRASSGVCPFWPPTIKIENKELGIHICKYVYEDENEEDNDIEQLDVKDIEVISIDKKILKKCFE